MVTNLVEKLLRRHPHVFAQGAIEGVVDNSTSVDEVKRTWETIKQEERAGKAQGGVLDNVPLALPALPRAQKLQKRAAGVNFDWSGAVGVIAKLEEEIKELREAISQNQPNEIAEEMGDVLFTCVNLARHLGLDAESSLRGANRKFERRFRHMESAVAAEGEDLSCLSPEELEQRWTGAKQGETAPKQRR